MNIDYERIDVHFKSEWQIFIYSVVDMTDRPDSTDCYFICEYLDQICDTFHYSRFHGKCYLGSTSFSNGTVTENFNENKSIFFTEDAIKVILNTRTHSNMHVAKLRYRVGHKIGLQYF